MTVEISLLISLASVVFAVVSGIINLRRNDRKDVSEEAADSAQIMTELRTIKTTELRIIKEQLTDIKKDSTDIRTDVKDLTEKNVRCEESLKSAHKRLDGLEERIARLERECKT